MTEPAEVTGAATLELTGDYELKLTGRPQVGKVLEVRYALERLPQCRGGLGGGAPAWNITGFYSENGGVAKTFAVSELSPDGRDRVAKAAQLEPSEGGDLALWFQVTSAFGCSAYDSFYGQNFHVQVAGEVPEASASLTFAEDGAVVQEGTLRAGERVKIRYAQARLPQCRRVERGTAVWNITGFASIDGAPPHVFGTGKPDGAERVETDVLLELPRGVELALWFQVHSLGGCSHYDPRGGDNYRFAIEGGRDE